MIVSVISPGLRRTGNSVLSILLGFALTELKRNILLTHLRPQSPSFYHYLGLKTFEDKTTTPSQLVKLMREEAIRPEEIGDYCKHFEDYLYIFTNNESNFDDRDMSTLLDFLLGGNMPYEYMLFDIDQGLDHPTTEKLLQKSHMVIFNLPPNLSDLDVFLSYKDRLLKLCKGKKILLVCNQYDHRIIKLKAMAKYLNFDTNIYVVRYNPWVAWACNHGKLHYFYLQGKLKNPSGLEVYKDMSVLASVVAKAKITLSKTKGGVR